MFTSSWFSRKNSDDAGVLFRENQVLKSQIQKLLQLEETGFFIELDSLLKAILKKALILCQADSSFFALTTPVAGELDVRICNLILDEKMKHIRELFKTEYTRLIESENVLITIEDFIMLPLIRRHRLLGIIGLKLNSAAPENVCEILPVLAHQAAGSLESAILYERMFKRLLVLSNVFILGKEIITNIDLGALVDRFLSIARDGTSSEVACIYLFKELSDKPFFTRIQLGKGPGTIIDDTAECTPLIRSVCLEGKPLLLEDLSSGPWAEAEPGKIRGIVLRNTLVLPLAARDRILGVIQVANKGKHDIFSPEDLDLLKILSGQIAFVIQNADLFQNLQQAYIDTLGALTSAIDAKDSYTHGHSKRVTELSMGLGQEINLGKSDLENLRIASILHDIGKIGIPESILNKPNRLTDEEFQIIKSHPELGVRILKNVEFLGNIVPIILHHHERFDGRGYPDSLKADEIPLAARIITISDSYDAMTSDRPYRKAMELDQACAELLRCKGSQFDPDLTDAFIRMMNRLKSEATSV
ncbi:MAG: HD domain-containing protein [Candidatus Riflebacteria bacterium]|nr:HD domain-containing protein [Candidatus Riflebacteria bacterium]